MTAVTALIVVQATSNPMTTRYTATLPKQAALGPAFTGSTVVNTERVVTAADYARTAAAAINVALQGSGTEVKSVLGDTRHLILAEYNFEMFYLDVEVH